MLAPAEPSHSIMLTRASYYGVCLARTRVLPKLFSRTTYSPMLQDGGACVATGCALCGLSIFAEQAGRRQEMAFFVAPRALATILPRRYDRKVCELSTPEAEHSADCRVSTYGGRKLCSH